MTKAIFDGAVIAQSDDVKVVEGMAYFPVDSVEMTRLTRSDTTSRCFWKGKATYWHVKSDEGNVAFDAAFAYERPWPLARSLVTDRVAFWQDVRVSG
jgi:uncharacterized protein (DUF427 family)